MVKAWRETVVIPTYEVGTPEKNPIFLEKRVYQGSSGVVYPYPVIESISDEKVDKEWHAIWIENEYIKVMILPELGGRVQMAYDKIKQRHFVYYNHVIKPALVGLTGRGSVVVSSSTGLSTIVQVPISQWIAPSRRTRMALLPYG